MGIPRSLCHAALILALAGCTEKPKEKAKATRDPLVEMMEEDAARNAAAAQAKADIDRMARALERGQERAGRQRAAEIFLLEERIDNIEEDRAIEKANAAARGERP